MKYENNKIKTVVAVNIAFPVPQIMNAMGHALIGLVAKQGVESFNLLPYRSEGYDFNSAISEYPLIVVQAKSSRELVKLVTRLKDLKISHNIFIDAMIGRNAQEQKLATHGASPENSNIMCVALHGEEEIIRPAIKSLSVYRRNSSVESVVQDGCN
jgi:hypothetical protein